MIGIADVGLPCLTHCPSEHVQLSSAPPKTILAAINPTITIKIHPKIATSAQTLPFSTTYPFIVMLFYSKKLKNFYSGYPVSVINNNNKSNRAIITHIHIRANWKPVLMDKDTL